MSHSGCSSGKLWRVQVYERIGCCEVKIFDTKDVSKKKWGSQSSECTRGMRPQKAMDLLEDWLFSEKTFDFENHAIYVNSRWLSLDSLSRGLKKIGAIFNEPLYSRENKE